MAWDGMITQFCGRRTLGLRMLLISVVLNLCLQCSTTVGSALITLQVHAGYGKHVRALRPSQIVETAKWTTSTEVQNLIGVYFVKVSVAFFVLRMISGTHRIMWRFLVGFMIVLSVLMVANVLLICLQCIPMQKIWNPELTGRCIAPSDVEKISKAFSGKSPQSKRVRKTGNSFRKAFGVTTDFLCVLLPLFVLHGLQMNPRTKAAIMVILGLGAL